MLIVLLCAGCGDRSNHSQTLTLFAGAGLQGPANELAEQFGLSHGVVVQCDYAGSETLLSRIKLSRIGDLYLPGDASYVEQAREAGLLGASRDVCWLVPVIIVAPGNPKSLHGPTDLAKPGLRVGLGNSQACAIGRTSAQLLAKSGVAESDLQDNVLFRSLTVNELGDKVKLGHLDAAIVWEAVAIQFGDDVQIVPIPAERNVVSRVPIAVLNCSQVTELAMQFAEFAASEAGREIFRRHGYAVDLPVGSAMDLQED